MKFQYFARTGGRVDCTGPAAQKALDAFVDSSKVRCPVCLSDTLEYTLPAVLDDSRPDTVMAFLTCAHCETEAEVYYTATALVLDRADVGPGCHLNRLDDTWLDERRDETTRIAGWTMVDNEAALAEGWTLDIDGTGGTIIVAADTGYFDGDSQAERYVVKRAKMGDDMLYRRAVELYERGVTRAKNGLNSAVLGGAS